MVGKIAVVRVRGTVRATQKVKDTLNMLGLHRTNYCVLVSDTPNIRGMILKVKDFVTWGNIDEETEKSLSEKLEKTKDKEGKETAKRFFRLNPPKKGYKATRLPCPRGDLGNRKEKINELLERMM